jgi:hypothetical protein
MAYINSVKLLHDGKYDKLDTVGKVRYVLFVKPGLGAFLPTQWHFLNPSVE